jgi:putative membrane protein
MDLYLPAIMAFLHHAAAFTVVTALGVEVALFKPPLTLVQARRVLITDTIFGASATALLIVGLLRVFFFEKGAAYYFRDAFFVTKLSLFVIAALISIYPTVLYLSWRKPLQNGVVPEVSDAQRKRARMCLMLELTAVLGIVFCAPFMARGFGYFG